MAGNVVPLNRNRKKLREHLVDGSVVLIIPMVVITMVVIPMVVIPMVVTTTVVTTTVVTTMVAVTNLHTRAEEV
jgi:hypothetical protein